MEALVWARVPGDIVFAIGVLAFAGFVFLAFKNTKKTVADKVETKTGEPVEAT